MPAGRVEPLDFEADCDRRYRSAQSAREAPLARLLRERHSDEDLTLAAWLHRRGYDGLAARALAAARDGDIDPRAELRERLAERAAGALRDAFCARADAAALAHGERLLRLYPDVARENHPQVADMVADLKRRQKAGTFGKAPPNDLPAGFAGWAVERKVAYLVDALDEIEGGTGQFGLGERNPINDHRYQALVDLGEPAVPALIDAIERDGRLTRCPVPERRTGCLAAPRSERGRVFTVRAVAETAARAILRVDALDPIGPGDEEANSPAAVAGLMRWYWDRYGKVPFPDRMMSVLTDPDARLRARQEAAELLVSAYHERGPSWGRSVGLAPAGPHGLHPALARFTGPTVGEVLLATLDERLRDQPAGLLRVRFVRHYAGLLADLGDPGVVPDLARRAAGARTAAERVAFATAAHRLGTSGPLLRLAREVEAGTVDLTPGDPAGSPARAAVHALGRVVRGLTEANLPEADRALYALADPAHPLHVLTAGAVRDEPDVDHDQPWRDHPFCLAMLRAALGDRRPTGGHYYLRGDEVEWAAGELQVDRRHTRPAADPSAYAEHVEERVCDEAAAALGRLVAGLPEFHALRRDADRTRAEINELVGRYGTKARRTTPAEEAHWKLSSWQRLYVPDIRPLGRPATATDVATGRAVFHLAGRGRVADVRLPAWVVLKADGDKPVHGLAVQAEVGPDGKLLYGAILRHAIRPVRAEEVERIESHRKE